MYLQPGKLHTVHPLRVVLVGGAGVTGKHALQRGAVGFRYGLPQRFRAGHFQMVGAGLPGKALGGVRVAVGVGDIGLDIVDGGAVHQVGTAHDEHRPDVGPVLIVRGADLMDGTPIYDIKPYIPYADCHPDAAAGFTAQTQFHHLTMVCDAGLWARVPADQQAALQGVLENDPRPSYQHDPERVYGMEFGGLEVHFKVDGEVLTVTGIDRR